MERLTKTYSDGTHGASDSLPCGENSYDYKNLLIERLGKYEDLEEQGRLAKLPCKVGDTVYGINTDRNIVSALKIISVKIYSYAIYFNYQLIDGIYKNIVSFTDFDIGKTVFLTKSEAETKLKELRGGE
mgnify:CR=1 FL=1|jgi:hypothetical protein